MPPRTRTASSKAKRRSTRRHDPESQTPKVLKRRRNASAIIPSEDSDYEPQGSDLDSDDEPLVSSKRIDRSKGAPSRRSSSRMLITPSKRKSSQQIPTPQSSARKRRLPSPLEASPSRRSKTASGGRTSSRIRGRTSHDSDDPAVSPTATSQPSTPVPSRTSRRRQTAESDTEEDGHDNGEDSDEGEEHHRHISAECVSRTKFDEVKAQLAEEKMRRKAAERIFRTAREQLRELRETNQSRQHGEQGHLEQQMHHVGSRELQQPLMPSPFSQDSQPFNPSEDPQQLQESQPNPDWGSLFEHYQRGEAEGLTAEQFLPPTGPPWLFCDDCEVCAKSELRQVRYRRNPNHGRWFYRCDERVGCDNFLLWADINDVDPAYRCDCGNPSRRSFFHEKGKIIGKVKFECVDKRCDKETWEKRVTIAN